MLNRIEFGKKKKPLCILLYGVKGVGKSSFALEAPSPVYLGSEDNSELDAAKFPQVRRWSDFEGALAALLKENHDFKTLVIDTVDNLQEIAELEILSTEPGKTMSTAFGGYGKAYEKMGKMFLDARETYLKPLREQKSMNIIFLAHAEKAKHEDPITVAAWDAYQTSLHKRIKPIFEDWVSAILFANYRLAKAESDQGKTYAEGDGSRVIYTEERPSHVAKNRFSLPYILPFKKTGAYSAIANHVDRFFAEKGDTADLEAEASDLLGLMPEELVSKIKAAVDQAKGNRAEMQKIIKKMHDIKSK